MTLHHKDIDAEPTKAEAEAALATLRRFAERAGTEELQALDPLAAQMIPGAQARQYPALARAYPDAFEVDEQYRAELPDLQNGLPA